MGSCDKCRYYVSQGRDEYVGEVGQCRINPPVYEYRGWNRFPGVKASAFCAQWKETN